MSKNPYDELSEEGYAWRLGYAAVLAGHLWDDEAPHAYKEGFRRALADRELAAQAAEKARSAPERS